MTRISSSALKIQNLYGVKKEFPLPVPMPVLVPSLNSSMQHRELKSEIDDMGHFLQGALYIIAAS